MKRGQIQAIEWAWVWGVAVGIILLNSLPYLYAALTTPDGWRYMGIMVNVPDHAQYFSWYKQYLTANLASNTLTPEPNAPIFFNLLWWGLGKLGAFLGLDYAASFQVLRVISTLAFCGVLYRLCAWFLDDRLHRLTAFLVAIFASGFGWVLIVLKYLLRLPEYPLDINLLIYIVEPNSFFSLFSTPHLSGAALYMLAFDWVLRGEAEKKLLPAVFAGLWTLFLGFQHAYDLFLVWGIIGAYGLLKFARDRKLPWYLIQALFIIGLLSGWPGLYSFLLTSLDPIWRDVLAQFDNAGVFTPAPWLLPILLGPAFLLALFTQIKDNPLNLRAKDDGALFLTAWFWANFLLVYLPTNYQIKMLNGWQVPIAILATQGLFKYVLPWLGQLSIQQRWNWRGTNLQRGLVLAFLAVIIPTNLYLFAWRFLDLGRHSYPYYLRTDELAALQWLDENADEGEVVLASLTLGQYVPALTGQPTFLAHWAQTVDYYGKDAQVREFFDAATSEARRREILAGQKVAYIFYGPNERALGGFNPNSVPWLTSVTSPSAEVSVFQVR